MRTQIRIRPFQCNQTNRIVEITILTTLIPTLGQSTPEREVRPVCAEAENHQCPHPVQVCPLRDH